MKMKKRKKTAAIAWGVRISTYSLRYGVVLLFLLLLLANILMTPNFVSINTFWNLIIQSSITILIALGMTLVITTGGMDISVGAVMCASAAVLARMSPYGFAVSVICCILTGMILGMFNGLIVSYFRLQPIVVTLATLMGFRGLAQMIGDSKKLPVYFDIFDSISYYKIAGVIPVQFFIISIVTIIFVFLVHKTLYGRYIEAIGGNRMAAEIAGIPVTLTLMVTYGLCGLQCGLAGVLDAARLGNVDVNNLGTLMEFDVVAAVAIGGTALSGGKARIVNSVIGAFLMQLITITVNMNNVNYAFSMVIETIVILLSVAVSGAVKRQQESC